MSKRSIIHMIDPMAYVSPFDINMAVDAGYDVVIPYANVELWQVNGLLQDAIFSREPKGVKNTAIFIGGRDIALAKEMMEAAKKAMVPPFEISVLADPSGAFTTAAALVACVEKELKAKHGMELKNSKGIIFGGTGPVGIATGVIASLAGADITLVSHQSIENAQSIANEYNASCGSTMSGTIGASDADKAYLLANVDIAFCTAKAGVEVLNDSVLGDTNSLKVVGDVNAVPPLGVRGLETQDFGVPLTHAVSSKGAVGIGALAVGHIKYLTQQALLKLMLETDKPVYVDFRDAFSTARELV
ncbi:MAG: methylenetetrahydromethanopterin dehydrogenase [Gammaproteobacteria bacterium]|nr:MAG: methylenetetrahydromethanopterin dehydrogenase [Gammaproteobacteria bacterium]